jgi:hypothetical protein
MLQSKPTDIAITHVQEEVPVTISKKPRGDSTMTTKIKTNRSPQVVAKSVSNPRGFSRFLVAIISLVALIIAFFVAINLTPAQPESNIQRGLEAETARYNGLATFYTAEQEANTSAFQAANPELSVAQRYAAVPEENEIGRSSTFDVESLRAKYFTDWGIEADAVDVSLLKQNAEANPLVEPVPYDFWIEVLRHSYNYQALKSGAANVNSDGQPLEAAPVNYRPVTFDTETLQQTYFADWGIEADAVDVTSTSAFQAANPELSVAQRYDAQVRWRRIHFPGR